MKAYLTKLRSFKTDRFCFSVSVTRENQIILLGKKDDGQEDITILDETGNVIKEITSKCSDLLAHFRYRHVTEHPTDFNYIIESCLFCQEIRSYNIHSGQGKTICDTCVPRLICAGPEQSLLVLDKEKQFLQLKWNKEKKKLECTNSVKTYENMDNWRVYDGMCYVKQQDIYVITSSLYGSVTAAKCTDGSILWEISGEINRQMIKPDGVTCSDVGRVYVPDGVNERLLVFDILDGKLHQEIELGAMGLIVDISWANNQLTVLCEGGRRITLFNVN